MIDMIGIESAAERSKNFQTFHGVVEYAITEKPTIST